MTDNTDYVLGPAVADWEVLKKPLAVDPVTFEIIRHKLAAINEEQALALKAVSVSPIVAGAGDFNNALFTADGRLASMGPQVVFHSGAMPVILRHVMEDFADEEFAEGDMYIVNDPYKGAVHHHRREYYGPVVFSGAAGRLGPGVTAHQVDMGGMAVGSVSVRATEKQQEGPDDAAHAYRRKRQPAQGCLAHDHEYDPPAADGRTGSQRFYRLQRGGP